jgi:3-oxoacyl-[acyl-carrier-protein] synthase-3
MRFSKVHLAAIGYELAPNVIASAALEDRLAPLYEALHLPFGQIEMLTGIRERRYWDPLQDMAGPAARAGAKALKKAGLRAADLGMVIFAGVCRDNLEPATSCAVAEALGISGAVEVFDVSNACLGVMNGMVHAAAAIEIGRVQAALVVSCESAREIVDATIAGMLANPTMDHFKMGVATLTGGSGAVGVVLTAAERAPAGHRLRGGVAHTAPQHHRLCRWGPETGICSTEPMRMRTDAAAVMEHGVKLGAETWRDFLGEMDWRDAGCDRVVCHQVGAWHRDAVLQALGIPNDRDYSTFPFLGNVGTVSLPITAAIGDERGFLQRGQRVGFLGIGSGLNCLMLGVEW